MSVQFGRWNFDGKPVDPNYLRKVQSTLAPYGPDDSGSYSNHNVTILYLAFHTTRQSHHETQPYACQSGAVITWDGRLDNGSDLIRELGDSLTSASTDVEIAAAAYGEWGADCFARLIGDWALAIWEPNTSSLILAKDPIGTRPLYYSLDRNQLTWSTILDPLVVFADKTLALDEEYIGGWLSLFPATHLTPYVGIHSVPPSCSVLIRAGNRAVTKYWDFDPAKKIRYRTDTEYEEHFRIVFAEAVRRRLRSDRPVLAELSGGMDSSSIVCMADTVIARGLAETPRVDTLSYYNDREPAWDERPYFTKVEEKRGRTGCHIDLASQELSGFGFEDLRFAAIPGSLTRSNQAVKQFEACMAAQGNRVVLSGIGGDETMGGLPTPTPELEDLFARFRFRVLVHQLKVWALSTRRPWLHLFFEAVQGFLPPSVVGVPKAMRPPSWLNPDFVRKTYPALMGYQSRSKFFGPLPSFQENIVTLDAMRRQLSSSAFSPDPPFEKAYPYLDRSLLEFIYAIPREQIVRPGQRRSLMRRALVGIVPDELLNRKRKAFVTRGPRAAISAEWVRLTEMTRDMVSSSLGIVDASGFSVALQRARDGHEARIVLLLRTIYAELWLQHLAKHEDLAQLFALQHTRFAAS
jgi:asparagine synthase (glutamine-hydrolysing)